MDILTKKKINILIQLAQADKHFADEEREMIYRIARERNFPEETVLQLIRNPEPIESLGALSPDQKMDYLFSAIEMIFADHRLIKSEILMCKGIAIKLGYNKKVIDFLVENYEKKGLDELKKKVSEDYRLA